MKRPINKTLRVIDPHSSEPNCIAKIADLNKMLNFNKETQEKLKKLRDQIKQRMHTLDEFVSTHRLRIQYPPTTNLLSYLKFQRNTPNSFREQSKVLQQQEAIRSTTQDDCQFIKKLGDDKARKAKQDIQFQLMPTNPRKINFIQLASISYFKSGLELYKAWFEYYKIKPEKRQFDSIEEELIIQKQKKYGDNWEKICQFFQNRSFEQIYYQFHNRLNPNIVTGRWTIRQSILLIVLLQHYGTKRWADIAKKMKCKSQLQVRQRFCNILDPSIGKNKWSSEMEDKLIQLAHEFDFSWKNMAKLPIFKNKTDNCLWRKFRNIMMKKTKQQIMKEIPNTEKKRLAEKIIRYKSIFQSKRKILQENDEVNHNERLNQQVNQQDPSYIIYQ